MPMYNNPEFQALRREYMQGVLERCQYLSEETERLRKGEPVDLRGLRSEIHKCRGSGGFYGFTALSGASAVAEDQLVLVLDGEAERNDQELTELVQRVVDAIHAAAREVGL
ncbi:MAG TPA: Hpt domain-containing protein [Symbiobacteriaceae bacterium]|nr:Hpt domain-containing protein [Symbiobacteriaceae bacterium]